MARVKRWTVPFVSLNGTSCRVDIYDDDWTGSVTTLTGAANPFEYEEDDDEDLLNGVIRYRTGYLRLIEQNHGDLDDLHPSVNTDRYIEFYYGSTLDFNGFIQAQEFEQPWESGPRELEFPVISPLGLAVGTKFSYANYNPPRWISVWRLIKDSFDLLNVGYTGYYFPQLLPNNPTQKSTVTTALWVNSLTICPFGNTYNKSGVSGDLTGIYEEKTVEDALTAVCTTYGVILHDIPGTPIFQRVDWDGDYFIAPFDLSGAQLQSQSITNMTTIADVASNENLESVVLPLSKIDITIDGSDTIPEMTFERCHGYNRGCDIADREFCSNLPNIQDIQGTFKNAVSIGSNGLLGTSGFVLGAYGGESLSEMIMYQHNDGSSQKIASYTFYEWWGQGMRLRFKFKYGDSIENLTNPDAFWGYDCIAVRIVHGDSFFKDSDSSWHAIGSTIEYTKEFNDGNEDCELEFLPQNGVTPSVLMVEFYIGQYNYSSWIHTISDVKLMTFSSASDAYLKKNVNPTKRVINGSQSNTEGSVTQGYDINVYNTNALRYNTNVVNGSIWVDIVNSKPSYPYLLTAQDRLQIDMKMAYQSPLTIYLNRFILWGRSVKWRTIARTFRPWDDIRRITFHHSTVFD